MAEGDPRVLVAMNAVLSFAFSAVVVGGLSFVGVVAFSWRTVGLFAAALFAITYLLVMR